MDGGGSLANQGVHTIDLIQWLCGPVAEVYGKFGVYAHEIEADARAEIEKAVEFAENSPEPDPDKVAEGVYA